MAVIPNKNVNLATNVRDVLSGAGGSVSNDTTSFFKPAAKINHWSKHKPLSMTVNFCQDFDSSRADYDADWWKGEDDFCGFKPKSIASTTQLLTLVKGDLNGWEYVLPSGGANSPYRLGDFAGYDSDAQPMIQAFYVPAEVSIRQTTGISATAFIPTKNNRSITLSDLSAIGNYYPAVYMTLEGSSETRTAKGTSSLSSGGFNINIGVGTNTGLNRTGNWTVYPYLADSNGNARYTIPNVAAAVITVKDTNLYVRCKAQKATDGSQSITWSAEAVNSSGDAVQFTEGYVYLMHFGRDPNKDTVSGSELQKPITSISEAKGNSTTVIASGTLTNIKDDIWNDTGAMVHVVFNPGAYSAKAALVQQMP